MNFTVKDKIGCLQKFRWDGTDKDQFRYIECKIKRISIGKKKISVYSEKFYPLDPDDLDCNTQIMNNGKGVALVGEPFITSPELAEKCKALAAYWNEHGGESIFDAMKKDEVTAQNRPCNDCMEQDCGWQHNGADFVCKRGYVLTDEDKRKAPQESARLRQKEEQERTDNG